MFIKNNPFHVESEHNTLITSSVANYCVTLVMMMIWVLGVSLWLLWFHIRGRFVTISLGLLNLGHLRVPN